MPSSKTDKPTPNRICFKKECFNTIAMQAASPELSNTQIIVAVEHSIYKTKLAEYWESIGVKDFVRMKSSLKFCVVASGEFDGYVAEARACEWDIAAGHAILQDAGGIITDFNGDQILYGKENFKNPSIILRRSKNL